MKSGPLAADPEQSPKFCSLIKLFGDAGSATPHTTFIWVCLGGVLVRDLQRNKTNRIEMIDRYTHRYTHRLR